MKVITLDNLVSNLRQLKTERSFVGNFLNKCLISNAIVIQDNITNGDVLKAVFPNMKINILDGVVETDLDRITRFRHGWWDSPYEQGE
jgi:hypothetical protein